MNFKTGIMPLPYTNMAMSHDAPLRLPADPFIIPIAYSDLGVDFTRWPPKRHEL